MIYPVTYSQPFKPDSLTFNLAKESGEIYSRAMFLNKNEHKNFKEINLEMEKYCKNNCKYLQSQSAQSSYQSLINSLKSYFSALKAFKKNPKTFSGEPKPPTKPKFLYKITFKKSDIRFKDNYLLLSTKKPNPPIRIPWSKFQPIPTWIIINYDRFQGWNINFVIEKEYKEEKLNKENILAIDLGVKRIATTFNSVTNEVTTYSGKIVMSLVRLRNLVDGRIREKKSKCIKKSRKYNEYQRAQRRIVRRIKNKQKDILHKYSKMIVQDAIKHNIGKIVIGNNSSTHNETNTGKENQKIQQNPEQKLKNFIKYKFERVSGITEVIPEEYTSRTCPKCQNVKSHSPKGRTYSCEKCGFEYDRDGVGSVNIGKKELIKNVSFDHRRWLDVVGGLTPPRGIKYIPQLSPNRKIGITYSKELVGLNAQAFSS